MTDSKDQAQSLFLNALEIPTEGERAAYVEAQCGADPELRKEVEELLDHARRLGPFLEPGDDEIDGTIAHPIAERPGTVIGPYKLLQQIGEGGMGVVFMAEQTEPIHRTVALKIIKPGMDTRQVIARFEAERQAVAMMDHPNIAKVLDAGTTGAGSTEQGAGRTDDALLPAPRSPLPATSRPYFVMELVKGVPITRYCDEKHLPLRARLELFTQVCGAVQHAHQKGIIHRDIKPNNVLVAEYDNHAVPKVIDFGVAKATAQKLTERTMFTEFGQVLGTMEYMSPEQSKFNQLDIDTRSDIYSLGVLLYELLAGSTPFEGKRLHEAAFDEMLRIIREEEPPKPSTRLSSIDTLPSVAANRHTEPARLSKDVRGELDWIVMKALEKDRNRRYETASSLAADIERHLHDEPVEAGPPSAAYRLKKFIRRNKTGVLAGSAVAVALIAGLILASIGFVQARRQAEIAWTQEQIARAQAIRSDQIAQFLQDMLSGVGPSVALGRDRTMLREILDKTAQRIATDLKEQPDVQLELRLMLGDIYHELREFRKMEDMARGTVALARSTPAQELAVADSLGQLGDALMHVGSKKESEACLREAIAMQKKLRGNESLQLASALYHLSAAIGSEENVAETESTCREALAMRRRLLGDEHLLVARSLDELGAFLMHGGRFAEAETTLRESLAMRKNLFDEEHPDMARSYRNLGDLMSAQNRWKEAEAMYRRGIEIWQRMLGSEAHRSPFMEEALAHALEAQGKAAEAEAALHDRPISSSSSPARPEEIKQPKSKAKPLTR